jgi:predicted phage terminase large subunit-like protein
MQITEKQPSCSGSSLKLISEYLKQIAYQKTILKNPYIPHKPTEKQKEALLVDSKELLYGGAAGGGKSDWLLMEALRYVSEPGYSAILFRRTFRDLSLPGALMDRSKEWLMPTTASFKGQENCWVFPSGAKLAFGYLDTETDKYRYQSAEFQFIGFDELTQFTEDQYRYLFSRLRRLESSHVPLRMRAASNPGGIGHDWVKQRFMVEGAEYGRVFIPAKLQDNQYIDQPSYIESLNNLDPITRRQYLDGDWTARHGGAAFKREKIQIIKEAPSDLEDEVIYWDKAATKPKATNTDPDWTVGVHMGIKQNRFYITNITRFREPPQVTEQKIRQVTQLAPLKVRHFIEQEPGSSGVESAEHYIRDVFTGHMSTAIKVTGSKAERAGPFASAVMAGADGTYGNVSIVQGTYVSAFMDEIEGFPIGSHDDQVDAASGAFQQLTVKFTPWVADLSW